MKKELNLVLSPEKASDSEVLKQIIAIELGVHLSEITFIQILKRSIDARSRNIKVNLKVDVLHFFYLNLN